MNTEMLSACREELNNIHLVKVAKGKEEISPGALAAGGFGVTLGGGQLTRRMGEATVRAGRAEGVAEGAGELLGRVRGGSPVHVSDLDSGAGPAYVSDQAAALMRKLKGPAHLQKEQILLGRSDLARAPGVLGHEIGHARLQRGVLGRLSQSIPSRLAFGLSRGGIAGIAAGVGASGTEDTTTGALIAGGVPAAMTLPTLGSEAGASFKGLGELRRAGASPAQIAAAKKTMLRAFGTYGGGALRGAGIGLGAYGVARARKMKKDK